MRFQPPAGLPILASSAYLAALVCSVGDHPAQTFPVALIDTRPHVGKPAATRYEVNEQAGTEVAVFAGKQIGHAPVTWQTSRCDRLPPLRLLQTRSGQMMLAAAIEDVSGVSDARHGYRVLPEAWSVLEC